MAGQPRGRCAFCRHETAKGAMGKHLDTCAVRGYRTSTRPSSGSMSRWTAPLRSVTSTAISARFGSNAAGTRACSPPVSGAAMSWPIRGESTRFSKTASSWSTFFCAWLYPHWQVRAKTYIGGAWEQVGGALTTKYCVPHGAGSWFEKVNTTAVTWSDGAGVSGAIGINLSSKTGFTSSTKIRYDFQQNRSLCGSNDNPAGNPRILQKRNQLLCASISHALRLLPFWPPLASRAPSVRTDPCPSAVTQERFACPVAKEPK